MFKAKTSCCLGERYTIITCTWSNCVYRVKQFLFFDNIEWGHCHGQVFYMRAIVKCIEITAYQHSSTQVSNLWAHQLLARLENIHKIMHVEISILTEIAYRPVVLIFLFNLFFVCLFFLHFPDKANTQNITLDSNIKGFRKYNYSVI